MLLDWETYGVLDDFHHCQRTSKNTDLMFHCTNGTVSAHQMIFAGISRLFKSLMQRYLVEQELFPLDLNVSLPEIRREHVEMVVEVVYTGQVRITKRDYQPFREICNILDLCVPIADYDKFFMNQCDNDDDDQDDDDNDDDDHDYDDDDFDDDDDDDFDDDDDDDFDDNDDDDDDDDDDEEDDGDVARPVDDAQFIHHSETQLPEVSKIPLPSCSSPRVFVCGECDAVFPLKIELIKHKECQHDETEAQVSDPQPSSPSPIASEPSMDTPVNTQARRQRSLNRENNPVCPPNDKSRVKCPDCQDLFAPKQVRRHLVFHLRNELNGTMKKCSSGIGLYKCELCSYETTNNCNLRTHLGLTHNMIVKLANEAQMKFLDDAENLIFEAESHKRKLVQGNKKISTPKTRKRILENEDCSDIEDKDVETEMENTLENESQALDEPSDALTPPMLTRSNRRASSLIKNKQVKQMTRVVKCPDCQKLVSCVRVQHHLVTHLRADLSQHLIKSKSTPELFKCQVCSFETSNGYTMLYHVGARHEIVMKYASEAQKKFIIDAQKLLTHKGRKTLYLNTRFQILEEEGLPEMEQNNVEIVIDNGQDIATESVSRQKTEASLICPDCRRRVRRRNVPNHLAIHLRNQIDEFIILTSETVPKVFNCKLCSHKSSVMTRMVIHVGVTHEMIETFANEEQKAFLYGTQIIVPKHAFPQPRNFSSKEGKKLKTRNQNVENEDGPEMPGNNFEIEVNNVQEIETDETESMRPKRLAKSRSGLNSSKLLMKAVPPWKRKQTGKQSVFAADGEPSVECPDCLRKVKPLKARGHLGMHMTEQLNEFVMDGFTANGLRKCKICPYEAALLCNVRVHLALVHNMAMRLANEAQKQFLYDAGTKSIQNC